jgi:hypothetical protein
MRSNQTFAAVALSGLLGFACVLAAGCGSGDDSASPVLEASAPAPEAGKDGASSEGGKGTPEASTDAPTSASDAEAGSDAGSSSTGDAEGGATDAAEGG